MIATKHLMLLAVLAMAAMPQAAAEGYTFTTLVGPRQIRAATDGTGSAARFNLLRGVAVDRAGNLYVADTGNHAIRKVTPDGVVTTLAGYASTADERGSLVGGYVDGAGAAARFNSPRSVAVDRAGNVYVADTDNYCIRKVTPDGVVTTLAGGISGIDEWGSPVGGYADGTGAAARFERPAGVAVDNAGNVYVGDTGNQTIRMVTPTGVVTTLAGLAGSQGSADGAGAAARFNGPAGVAVDGVGNVYVAETFNHTIRKVTPAGTVTTLAGNASIVDEYGSPAGGHADGTGKAARFNSPEGLAVDHTGNVFVADTRNSTIRKIGPGGDVTTFAGQPEDSGSSDGTGAAARFNRPASVAVDGAGNLYVGDTRDCTLRKITPGGEATTLAGQPASPTEFGLAAGLAVTRSGSIFVADYGRHTIQEIGPGGVVTTFAGKRGEEGSSDGIGAAARFYGPSGLAADAAGNLYVADTGNATIRKISPAGEVTTLAGMAGVLGSADGAGNAARFTGPEGLAVDDAGNVYVGDPDDHTIRKVTPGGVVTTLAGMAGQPGSADGTGSGARFRDPCGVAVDGSGCVYVADWNNLIRKISPDGEVTTLAGEAGQTNEWGGVEGGYADGAGAAARFHSPYGVALDKTRNLYVTDAHNNCIRKVTPDGVVTTLAGKPGCDGNTDGTGSEARFTLVERGWLFCIWAGIAVDENGTLYVADSGGGPLNFFEDWNSRWPSTIRVGVKAGPDRPILDLPLAPVGVQRQLDTAPRTATAWQWSQLRRPAGSQAELSSTATPNPTFTPDVADLYVFQLLATNAVTGEASLRTLEVNTLPANVAVLASPQRQADGSLELTLLGQASQSYTLQVSSDLTTWTDWVNVTPQSCTTPVTDPEAAQGTHRFYRARTR